METEGYHLEETQLRNSVLFCGAGISKGSGLPLANDLKRYILEKLLSDTDEVQEMMSAELPFELFLETIVTEEGQYFKLLDLYTCGVPNATHTFIAKLVKFGLLKKIVTTNFDLLIEKAFSTEGLVENVDYKRFYLDEHFSPLDSQTIEKSLNGKAGLFKIHGSADDAKSVRTTLERVASKLFSAKTRNVLWDIFSGSDNKQVILMGYSCSDIFDVNPIIQSIEPRQGKALLFIDHVGQKKEAEAASIEGIRKKALKEPFHHFRGERVCCDTDLLVKNSWMNLADVFGTYKTDVSVFNWVPFVDSWYEDLAQDEALVSYVAGKLFSKISDFDKAEYYYLRALDGVENGNQALRFNCYVALGEAHKKRGYPREAVEYYEKALEATQRGKEGQQKGVPNCYCGLAECYGSVGDGNRALQFFFEAIRLEQNLQDINSYHIVSGASRGIGMLLYFQGYHDGGSIFIEKSLEIAQDTGDTSLQALCYVNQGMICHKNEPTKAFEYFTRALTLAKAVSDKAIQAGCYTNLGIVSRETKQWMKAERYINEALRIATSTGDQTVEPLCYAVLGNISLDNGYASLYRRDLVQAERDLILAANRHYQALMLAEAVDNATVIILSCAGLSQAYSLLGAYRLGVEYGQQAAKYAERFGNKEVEASCYAMIGLAFDRLGKSEEAANSFSKQKECLEQASKSHPLFQQIDQIKELIPTKTKE